MSLFTTRSGFDFTEGLPSGRNFGYTRDCALAVVHRLQQTRRTMIQRNTDRMICQILIFLLSWRLTKFLNDNVFPTQWFTRSHWRIKPVFQQVNHLSNGRNWNLHGRFCSWIAEFERRWGLNLCKFKSCRKILIVRQGLSSLKLLNFYKL